MVPDRIEGNDPFGLRRLSLKRYSVRHMMVLFTAAVLLSVVTIRSAITYEWLSFALSVTGMVLIWLVIILIGRMVVRRVVVEQWIRRLGMGDFEYTVAPWGNDEMSKCCIALESLRQKAIEAMQLDLVRSLSEEVQTKNDDLEKAMDELRRTQDQVVSQQKLLELRELTTAIAHQLSNPLNFVSNFSESCIELIEDIRQEMQCIDSLPTEQRRGIDDLLGELQDSINRLLSHSNRAASVVQGALKLGQSHTGQFAPVNINSIVRTEVSAIQNREQYQTIDFDISLDDNGCEVWGIAEDLSRVVSHLVDNAADAVMARISENGSHPYSPSIFATTRQINGFVEIRVHDNGVGITLDDLHRIFNPFFTTKATGEGTGLGLTLAHDIAREHGATITVDSRVGEYTEFKFTIPAVSVEESGYVFA